MKISYGFSLLLLFILIGCQQSMESTKHEEPIEYPETFMDTTVVDDYHGTAIKDPYRWLEDDHSEETKDWVVRQNKVTDSYLSSITFRKDIEKRLEEIWNYERVGPPFKKGDHFYYYKNDGLQNQNVLYRVVEEGEDEVVLDPNSFSKDGTTSLGSISFSKDGKFLAYQTSEGGSDWATIKVMDLESGNDLEDEINWVKFSGMAWNGNGFYYSRYPSPEDNAELSGKNEFHKVYYHQLGAAQGEDVLIFEDKEHPQRNAYAGTSEDENWLIINQVESTSGNAVMIKDLENDGPITTVIKGFENDYNFIDAVDGQLLFVTNYKAPFQKLIAIDPSAFEEDNWKEIIPETDYKLNSVKLVGGKIVASYLKNASSQLSVFDMAGNKLHNIELPGIGTVGSIQGQKEDDQIYYSFTSFTSPTRIYQASVSSGKSELQRAPEVKFNPDDYVTEQQWYESKDGTKVPVFITHKKGLKKDGKRPTLLYGYGGFDISIAPSFSPSRMLLLENDGVLAVANIRGGGEFGSEWHKAGTLERKQNVFDDFIAAAEFLINSGYTQKNKLAIEGGSNGGLLVGACMTQRPDLFQVAFPRVGVLDMLRYHEFTIGWAWATDYGRSDDKEAFDYLIKYSPLHNVKATAYPATMIMTADHDDRVVPAHSFKFGAELQRRQTGPAPILIRIETSAGHGAGKPTSKRIEEEADKWAFMFSNMNETVDYTELKK